jgi:peptide/nickel transport system ATP-binding protein/oligopeptide transport system ATP-binding protein
MSTPPLLSVRDLQVHFPIRSGILQRVTGHIKAVDGISFDIPAGASVGLVGESGSGKSTTGKAIVRLVEPTAGSIHYQGTRIDNLARAAFFPYRKKIQMIFQDPVNSLNPRMTVAQILGEPLEIHFPKMKASARLDRCQALLETVGLEARHIDRYPHEFSGGQRQRIGIARALAVEPEFLICDEPVSALDVSVQAQIINLLQDLQEKFKLTYLFISHDLAVVEHFCDRVLVMQSGRVVEDATAEELYQNPKHDYTKKLLAAVPELP